jgi:phage tail-like protein
VSLTREEAKVAIARDKPYPNTNFLVAFSAGGDPDEGVEEVVFPEARFQVMEYRSGNENSNEPRKILTLLQYGNLILKRGVKGSLTWYNWWNNARNGTPDTRNVSVVLLDEDHKPVLRWNFLRAQPANYQNSPLNALVAGTLVENLELAFERMEME